MPDGAGEGEGDTEVSRDRGWKGYYRASSSVTSSLVMTTCSGTSYRERKPPGITEGWPDPTAPRRHHSPSASRWTRALNPAPRPLALTKPTPAPRLHRLLRQTGWAQPPPAGTPPAMSAALGSLHTPNGPGSTGWGRPGDLHF